MREFETFEIKRIKSLNILFMLIIYVYFRVIIRIYNNSYILLFNKVNNFIVYSFIK